MLSFGRLLSCECKEKVIEVKTVMKRRGKMKKNSIIASMMVICMAIIMFAPASVSAANVCNQISGDSVHTKTFYVTTSKGWFNNQSIKIKQSKGTLWYRKSYSGGYKKVKEYAGYYVTVRNAKTNRVYKYYNKDWEGASIKLSLGKNTKYKIRIEPCTLYSYGWARNYHATNWDWDPACVWSITKTKNVTLCR